MVKQLPAETLLCWSKLVPVSEGQDPLGLNLRVSARLASQLLYCITSITPRARYFSILPWCISRFSKDKRRGFWQTVLNLEKAFVIGCVANHEGEACRDGRLVGSENIIKWFNGRQRERVDLTRADHVRNPALSAYIGSLSNLRLFENAEETEEREGENTARSINDLELSPLGKEVAASYEKVVQGIPVTRELLKKRGALVEDLKLWGKMGGLCELRDKATPDRQILTELLFNKVGFESPSHNYRRQTLLLLLHLAQHLSGQSCPIDAPSMNDAVYFGQILNEEGRVVTVKWPKALADIAMRWRMFHFHYYFSAVMENLFVNLVNRARQSGIEGFRLKDMVAELGARDVSENVQGLLSQKLGRPFPDLTPSQLLKRFGLDIKDANAEGSMLVEQAVRIRHTLSEKNLHTLLLSKDQRFTPESTIISLILWSVFSLRFIQWEQSKYGNWLAGVVKDPYEDLAIPVVIKGMRIRFGDYWNTPFRDLSFDLMNRFVIQLHQILAYQKSGAFFYCDQDLIRWRGLNYDSPAYGNPRFGSALLILKDLGLLKENNVNRNILALTNLGKDLLRSELANEEGV